MTDLNTPISFEFFPPRTEAGQQKLKATWTDLKQHQPQYFSCTFGAGGSTQEGTLDTVVAIQKDTGIDSAPHISCIGQDKQTINQLLQQYKAAGIKRLVALRGDRPSGMVDIGDFKYANELVAYIRAETGSEFHIEIAAYPEYHPEARNPASDIENFVRKAQAGADAAITQYFYNADAYWQFVEKVRQQGVDIAITPGIMPITNFAQLARFSDTCGAEIPRWIRNKLQSYDAADDMVSLQAFGLDVVSELCQKLIAQGAPSLHFYTLNQSKHVNALIRTLG